MVSATLETQGEAGQPQAQNQWLSVSVLAFGVFVVGTGEFVLAGLLPLLSSSLGVSPAVAGQVVTIFALTCALAGPLLTTATGGWNRRTALVAAALVYLAGSVWTALAPREQVRMLQLLINKVVFDALDSSIEVSFYPSGVKALAGGAVEGPEAQA